MNTNKLRAKMALYGDTGGTLAKLYGDTGGTLAKALGLSPQWFSRKLNEKNAEFTQGEIQAIKDRYNLTAEEVDEIFLI